MTQHSVALITDSTNDIPDELLARYDISYVPSFIIWGTDILRDRIDMGADEFYRRLQSDPMYPTTAHPTPDHFRAAYEAAHTQGASEIVVITVSSAMSGTNEAANVAAGMVDFPVHVIDSKGPTMTLGWQVLAAARAREAGGDCQAMVEAAARARQAMAQWVSLDTLEYLHKGGRIGNATRFIGTLLNIKPLVYINHQTGLVEAGPLTRTRRRSIEALREGFLSQVGRDRLHVAVLHGGVPDEAAAMAERIQADCNPVELIITTTTPVLGVHTGPRAMALAGYAEG